ncbi:MAG: phenylalanine--tRNA ligase subunit alpha, partial [Candidatus Cloacimonetes bacterium]|nr:phenylalanine--tRNA ligase subunit alpha [Candidatus Cloacimonadota bacterium]
MITQLNKILESAKNEIQKAGSIHELQQLKSRFLGKKSEIMNFMKKLGNLPREERPAFGKA